MVIGGYRVPDAILVVMVLTVGNVLCITHGHLLATVPGNYTRGKVWMKTATTDVGPLACNYSDFGCLQNTFEMIYLKKKKKQTPEIRMSNHTYTHSTHNSHVFFFPTFEIPKKVFKKKQKTNAYFTTDVRGYPTQP